MNTTQAQIGTDELAEQVGHLPRSVRRWVDRGWLRAERGPGGHGLRFGPDAQRVARNIAGLVRLIPTSEIPGVLMALHAFRSKRPDAIGQERRLVWSGGARPPVVLDDDDELQTGTAIAVIAVVTV